MTRKVSILFVDDEPNILRAVRRHVRHFRDQWDVHFAYGGVDAVKVITRENIDIIVTDMRMPEVDGPKLLEWISEHHPKIIRVVLSGEAKLEEIYRIVGRSHRFLAKPCSPESIIAVLFSIVDAQLHDQLENGVFELSMLDKLGTPASTFQALRVALDAEEADIAIVQQIVGRDPSLSLRVLQLSNSAYFKQPISTCNVKQAVNNLGVDRLRDLAAAGRLGQDSRASAEAQQSSDEAYWLARACRNQCAELSKDHDHLAAAYILGLMVRCGAVDASGTLAQVAKRAAFLTVLLGLPQVLHDTLIELATSNAAAPFEKWPRLIANAIYESEIKPSKNEVAA
ncbi:MULTISPECIES: HDOD domain-containing protein [unclassified Roseibium]|uniref:HDOD domain-containing protein n=1 Tax=unclassified Roseibium TaxID=2629323 RepID=UPI00273E09F5|nr:MULTISPECIES: HDOD domain-containing protein [unclassified Roseibium]